MHASCHMRTGSGAQAKPSKVQPLTVAAAHDLPGKVVCGGGHVLQVIAAVKGRGEVVWREACQDRARQATGTAAHPSAGQETAAAPPANPAAQLTLPATLSMPPTLQHRKPRQSSHRGTAMRLPLGSGRRKRGEMVWPMLGAATATPLAGAACSSTRKARTCKK